MSLAESSIQETPTHVAKTTPSTGTGSRPPANDAAWSKLPVVADAAMVRVHRMAARAAATDITVLLLGESGTGKEILAEAVHRNSSRRDRPFLRIHCAAVPEHLLESELFGHEKGSFSGATQTKPGLLETAEGGTVLLDEIGDMPLSLQPKLLRVLEDHQVMRLGSLRNRSVDVRFVAATNRNLEEDARRGTFRLDLYYRLNGFCIELPPLRDRLGDIEPLTELFLRRAADATGLAAPRLSSESLALLLRYSWPGNVRELRNVIERAVILASDTAEITPDHLPGHLLDDVAPPAIPSAALDDEPSPVLAVSGGERDRIIDALARCGGNQSAAAKLLGMSRNALIKRVRTYGLPRPQDARRQLRAHPL